MRNCSAVIARGGGPEAAMLTKREIFDRAYGTQELAEVHNSTFSGNALSCVAALAGLELLTDELLAQVRASGERFGQGLRPSHTFRQRLPVRFCC